MLRHISMVGQLNLPTMGVSGVVQVGDSNSLQARSRAFLVQRELPFYFVGEGDFENYAVFRDDEITIPTRQTSVRMHVENVNPFITVDILRMLSIENSGTLHIGSIDYVFNNSRILQVRQFISSNPFAGPSPTESDRTSC